MYACPYDQASIKLYRVGFLHPDTCCRRNCKPSPSGHNTSCGKSPKDPLGVTHNWSRSSSEQDNPTWESNPSRSPPSPSFFWRRWTIPDLQIPVFVVPGEQWRLCVRLLSHWRGAHSTPSCLCLTFLYGDDYVSRKHLACYPLETSNS